MLKGVTMIASSVDWRDAQANLWINHRNGTPDDIKTGEQLLPRKSAKGTYGFMISVPLRFRNATARKEPLRQIGRKRGQAPDDAIESVRVESAPVESHRLFAPGCPATPAWPSWSAHCSHWNGPTLSSM